MISSAHDHILFKFKNLNKNIPVPSCLQVYSCQSEELNLNPLELNTKYYVKTIVPTFVPTLGTYFLCLLLYSKSAYFLAHVPTF